MSFGVGLGDVVLVAQTIVNTVQAIRNIPAELEDLAVRVESIEVVLQAFGWVAPSTESGAKNEVTETSRTAKLLKKNVKDVLLEMEVIVKTYQDANFLQRIKFLARTKGDLPGLELKLSQRTDALTTWLTVQNFGKTDKLQELLERSLLLQEQKENESVIIEKLDQLKIAINSVRQGEKIGQSKEQDDNAFSETDIEQRFTDAGLSNADASTLMATITPRRNGIAHPKAGGIKPEEASNQAPGPETGWIMVVDQGGGARSVIGQMYLELVRIWTLNTSGRWLFDRVISAGTHISTGHNKPLLEKLSLPTRAGGDTVESGAIDAVAGRTWHNSGEKTAIITRMRRHRKRGIDEWHFRHYEYMLCFDQSSFNVVHALKEACKKKHANNSADADLAKVRLIADLPMENTVGSLRKEEVDKLVENVKTSIKGFLRGEMQWTEPTQGIKNGPYRTVQIVLPTKKVMPMLGGLLGEIKRKTECRIWVTYYQNDEKKLLTVTGQKDTVNVAISLLQAG